MVGPCSSVLLLRFFLKIRSARILYTIVCPGTLLWLFSLAWDTIKPTLQVGFICPFVVLDPTCLDSTIMVAQALCLTIFNLSQYIPLGKMRPIWAICMKSGQKCSRIGKKNSTIIFTPLSEVDVSYN